MHFCSSAASWEKTQNGRVPLRVLELYVLEAARKNLKTVKGCQVDYTPSPEIWKPEMEPKHLSLRAQDRDLTTLIAGEQVPNTGPNSGAWLALSFHSHEGQSQMTLDHPFWSIWSGSASRFLASCLLFCKGSQLVGQNPASVCLQVGINTEFLCTKGVECPVSDLRFSFSKLIN